MSEDTGAPAPQDAQQASPAVTFTQADVDRIVAERIARERGKYADYGDLKVKAGTVDQLAAQLDDATSKAAQAEAEAAKLRVAFTHGLTPDDLEFLGDDPGQFEARAEKLRARIGSSTSATPSGPRPDPSQGARTPSDAALNGDPLLRDLKAALGAR